MEAAGDSKSLRKEVRVCSSFRQEISCDSFLYEKFFVLRQVDIRGQPLHGLLHGPVVDLGLGPGLPEVPHCYLLVFLVEEFLSPAVSDILRVEKVIAVSSWSFTVTNVIMQPRLRKTGLVRGHANSLVIVVIPSSSSILYFENPNDQINVSICPRERSIELLRGKINVDMQCEI